MTDLVGEQEVFFSNATSSDQSLLLQRLKVEQLPWGREDETPQMTYERYTVSVPALYPFCVGQMKRQMLIKAYWDGEMVSMDATPWGGRGGLPPGGQGRHPAQRLPAVPGEYPGVCGHELGAHSGADGFGGREAPK